MNTTTKGRNMAKRNDIAVKVDAVVITKAKMIAAGRNTTLAEYLSEALRPIVKRDLDATYESQRGADSPAETSTSRKKAK